MGILNNRELATAIWVAIFVLWVLWKIDVGGSIKELIQTLLVKAIVIPFSLLFFYVLISIWLLNVAGLWEQNQVKNTIFWFFTVAIVSFFRSPHIADDPYYFRNAIKDNLKIIVLLEFIFTSYTFSLIVELVFVPLMTFTVVMLEYSKNKKMFELVEKITSRFLELVGGVIIIFTLYKLIMDFSEFAKEETFFDFITPVLLSLLLLPYIYVLHVYLSYEKAFFRLRYVLKNKDVISYAKKVSIIKFRLNLDQLKWWIDTLYHQDIVSKYGIDKSINVIERLSAEKKNPPVVPKKFGWSPYKASSFLYNEGLKTSRYKRLYDNEWSASSNYLNIGDGVLPNNISYHMSGDDAAVKRLKLKMIVNEEEYEEESHKELIRLISELYTIATNSKLPKKIHASIMKSKNIKIEHDSRLLHIVTEQWGDNNAYEVVFSVEVSH